MLGGEEAVEGGWEIGGFGEVFVGIEFLVEVRARAVGPVVAGGAVPVGEGFGVADGSEKREGFAVFCFAPEGEAAIPAVRHGAAAEIVGVAFAFEGLIGFDFGDVFRAAGGGEAADGGGLRVVGVGLHPGV